MCFYDQIGLSFIYVQCYTYHVYCKKKNIFNSTIIFLYVVPVCLQAVESIRAVVALCDSADEELRHVAIETLLTFGKFFFFFKLNFAQPG